MMNATLPDHTPIYDDNDEPVLPHPENWRVLLQEAHYRVGKQADLDVSHNNTSTIIIRYTAMFPTKLMT